MSGIAYYVTAHGYGHGVRSCDIIRALNEICPGLPVTIVSDLAEDFFRNRLKAECNSHRSGSLDVGMVQLDSIRVDVEASLRRAERLLAERQNLIARETEFLRSGGFRLVVSDIAAIPVEAAKCAGLSAVAVGNFSWDWIYSAFTRGEPRWKPVVESFAAGYAQADLLLRLPFAGEMKAFSRIEDVPLLASPGRSRRADIAALTGSPPDATWILLSFTTLEWREEALDSVERMSDCRFFTVLPLCWKRRNIHSIDRECIPFPDIVASVDAVVSKPGYGIVSECVVNRKPLIYADRSDFLEYAALEFGIRKYLKQVHIPAQRLYAGDLRAAVDSLMSAPDPTGTLSAGGAPIAARRILDFLS